MHAIICIQVREVFKHATHNLYRPVNVAWCSEAAAKAADNAEAVTAALREALARCEEREAAAAAAAKEREAEEAAATAALLAQLDASVSTLLTGLAAAADSAVIRLGYGGVLAAAPATMEGARGEHPPHESFAVDAAAVPAGAWLPMPPPLLGSKQPSLHACAAQPQPPQSPQLTRGIAAAWEAPQPAQGTEANSDLLSEVAAKRRGVAPAAEKQAQAGARTVHWPLTCAVRCDAAEAPAPTRLAAARAE